MWLWKSKPAAVEFAYKRYRDGMAPIIPLQVKAGKQWRRIWGYVDSGAAYSILKVADARRLGLMKIRARRIAITTSGGRTQAISLHRLWVKLGKDRFSITFGVPRGFDIDFNLLGRRDLFQRYEVAFDDADALLTLTRHRRK